MAGTLKSDTLCALARPDSLAHTCYMIVAAWLLVVGTIASPTPS
jgi:hypothetical protein